MGEDAAPAPRRRRAWPWVLGSVAGLLVLGLATWGWAVARARRILQEAHAEALAELEKLRRGDWSRPPLGGVALEGDAWDYYKQHLPAFGQLSEEDQAVLPAISGDAEVDSNPDDAAIARVFERLRPSIEGMRRGARCPTGNPGFRHEVSGTDLPLPNTITFTKAIIDFSAHLRRTGRSSEAADLLALGWSVSREAGQGFAWIGLLIRTVLDGMLAEATADLISKADVDAKATDLLAGELDRLLNSTEDRRRAWSTDHWSEVAKVAGKGGPPDEMMSNPQPDSLPPMRSLYSWTVERARFLQRMPRYFEAPLLSLPLHDALQAAKRVETGPNAVVQDGPWSILKVSRILSHEAKGLMHRRLTRLLVAAAAYQHDRGTFPARLEDLVPKHLAGVPLCPLSGQPFRTKDGAVWSVGEDGIDNGGTAAPGGNDPAAAGTDVVFRVRRR